VGTRGSFLGLKWPGREADHSPPSSAEVKEWVDLYLLPNTSSGRGAHVKCRDKFIFTSYCITCILRFMKKKVMSDTFSADMYHIAWCLWLIHVHDSFNVQTETSCIPCGSCVCLSWTNIACRTDFLASFIITSSRQNWIRWIFTRSCTLTDLPLWVHVFETPLFAWDRWWTEL
jgi:hypothetical protein